MTDTESTFQGTGVAIIGFAPLEPRGNGAYGPVYETVDVSGSVLRLEVISRFPIDDTFRRRFDHEAEVLRLSARACRAGDVSRRGYTTDGLPFFVLDRHLRLFEPQAGDWRFVVAAGVSLAQTLAAAHDAGILHRDVRPDNVLSSAAREVYLGRFGIGPARFDEFVAPEVRTGHASSPGDLYALSQTLLTFLNEVGTAGAPLDLVDILDRRTHPDATQRGDARSFAKDLERLLGAVQRSDVFEANGARTARSSGGTSVSNSRPKPPLPNLAAAGPMGQPVIVPRSGEDAVTPESADAPQPSRGPTSPATAGHDRSIDAGAVAELEAALSGFGAVEIDTPAAAETFPPLPVTPVPPVASAPPVASPAAVTSPPVAAPKNPEPTLPEQPSDDAPFARLTSRAAPPLPPIGGIPAHDGGQRRARTPPPSPPETASSSTSSAVVSRTSPPMPQRIGDAVSPTSEASNAGRGDLPVRRFASPADAISGFTADISDIAVTPFALQPSQSPMTKIAPIPPVREVPATGDKRVELASSGWSLEKASSAASSAEGAARTISPSAPPSFHFEDIAAMRDVAADTGTDVLVANQARPHLATVDAPATLADDDSDRRLRFLFGLGAVVLVVGALVGWFALGRVFTGSTSLPEEVAASVTAREADSSELFGALSAQTEPVLFLGSLLQRTVMVPEGHNLVQVAVTLTNQSDRTIAWRHEEVVPPEISDDVTVISTVPLAEAILTDGLVLDFGYVAKPQSSISFLYTVSLDGSEMSQEQVDAWMAAIVTLNAEHQEEILANDPSLLADAPPEASIVDDPTAATNTIASAEESATTLLAPAPNGAAVAGELSVDVRGIETVGIGEYTVFEVVSAGVTEGSWSITGGVEITDSEWAPGQNLWVEMQDAGQYTITLLARNGAGDTVVDRHSFEVK